MMSGPADRRSHGQEGGSGRRARKVDRAPFPVIKARKSRIHRPIIDVVKCAYLLLCGPGHTDLAYVSHGTSGVPSLSKWRGTYGSCGPWSAASTFSYAAMPSLKS
jgi:hypothetical protein